MSDKVEQALEIARNYVDPTQILDGLATTDFSFAERQDAALTVHYNRVREVANLAGSLLLDRRQDLLDKRAGLLEEVRQVDDQLNEFDASHGSLLAGGNSLNSFQATSQKISERFAKWYRLDKNELVLEAAKSAPFVIEMPAKSILIHTDQAATGFGLIDWAESRKDLLDQLCGKWSKNSFLRVAYSFHRRYSRQDDLDRLAEKVGSGEVVMTGDEVVAYRLFVERPQEFAESLKHVSGIGVKSITALFAVADVQAMERDQAR